MPEGDPGPPADEVVDGEDDTDAADIAEPRRYAGFRIALGRFAGQLVLPGANDACLHRRHGE